MFDHFVKFVRELYQSDEFIPLHAPLFSGNEKKYLCDAIDSTFVSSVSDYVPRFEAAIGEFTGSKYAVATMNGTAALHLALHCCGVNKGDEVITQAFSFVATANAIRYCNATPVFIDISPDTLGMDADALERFLQENAESGENGAINKSTGRRIAACVPMHTFGHPVEIDRIAAICQKWNIALVEDAAEALGSYFDSSHCGTMGNCSVLSFNGNKVITTGGGGAVITNDEILAKRLRHLATTAKVSHQWEFRHDELGFNYRMPGINAALGCAQFESLPGYLKDKLAIAAAYQQWAAQYDIRFVEQPPGTKSNYWLNALEFHAVGDRDEFLQVTNAAGIMTRPPWNILSDLPEFEKSAGADDLPVSRHMQQCLVNIPSGMRAVL